MSRSSCLVVALLCLPIGPAVGENGSVSIGSFARDMLLAHNEIRMRVDVPRLRWSDRLAARAEDWASHLLHERQFYHRPHPIFGENLFEITGGHATPDQVVDAWASEAHDYSYRSNTCRAVCGHYTQLVWSGTREVGCAIARDAGREVWVCNYDPPGNWIGERPY
jgi:pathogenesis-related protein 1